MTTCIDPTSYLDFMSSSLSEIECAKEVPQASAYRKSIARSRLFVVFMPAKIQ